MATTTNFGWTTPDDTALVKDGASAIRTLGSAIDTSLVDLKGGTTDQVLAKNSNTDLDYKWVASGSSKVVQIVYGSTGTDKTVTSNVYVDSNLTATITPTSASNKVLVMVTHGSNQKDSSNTSMGMRLFRGATQIAQILVDGGKDGASGRQDFGGTSINVLDEPATTSATTYKTQINSQNNSSSVSTQSGNGLSTIILMEVTP
jgi:hypothetical protein